MQDKQDKDEIEVFVGSSIWTKDKWQAYCASGVSEKLECIIAGIRSPKRRRGPFKTNYASDQNNWYTERGRKRVSTYAIFSVQSKTIRHFLRQQFRLAQVLTLHSSPGLTHQAQP